MSDDDWNSLRIVRREERINVIAGFTKDPSLTDRDRRKIQRFYESGDVELLRGLPYYRERWRACLLPTIDSEQYWSRLIEQARKNVAARGGSFLMDEYDPEGGYTFDEF